MSPEKVAAIFYVIGMTAFCLPLFIMFGKDISGRTPIPPAPKPPRREE